MTSLKEDLRKTNWQTQLQLEKKDVDNSFTQFILIFNDILDQHAPIQDLSLKKRKTLSKPWITKEILRAIKIKNDLYHRYCRAKNERTKNEIYTQFKYYRNMISNQTQSNKDQYYKKYFLEHKKNAQKVWQGIKELINIKSTNKFSPKSLNINDIYLSH